jgi:hypothetical protein
LFPCSLPWAGRAALYPMHTVSELSAQVSILACL